MSVIYNVTVKVEHSIAPQWLEWLRGEHIPEVIATGCFTDWMVLRLLETDETDGLTYAIQYRASSKEMYNRYITEFAIAMREKGYRKWGNRFIAFRSVMEVVN